MSEQSQEKPLPELSLELDPEILEINSAIQEILAPLDIQKEKDHPDTTGHTDQKEKSETTGHTDQKEKSETTDQGQRRDSTDQGQRRDSTDQGQRRDST